MLTISPGMGLQVGDRSPSRRTVIGDRLAIPARIDDAGADRLLLADDAEARRLDELDATIALAFMASDQGMNRRA